MSKLKLGNTIETVSCYLIKDNKILLLYRNKKKKDINKNKWIGVGGHIEPGETPLEAVAREVKEETNLDIIKPVKRAIIIFHFKDQIEMMHLYTCSNFKGTMISDCPEGQLEWIDIDKIFELPLWEGDKYFIKPILDNEPFFEMVFWYDEDKLVKHYRLSDKGE